MKTSCMLVLAVLLCSVVHVYCQEVPYITFNGDTLPNHSYLEFSQIGHSRSNSVRCHTDLTTCCSGAQGNDRGDWYFPNGNRLQFSDRIYESRNSRVVILGNERYYDPRNLMEGIYKCTIAVQADTETRETVYIGLYNSGGEVSIPDGMSFNLDSELMVEVPQFTLTCISTGGPATTVSWTRDSQEIAGGTTLLDDRVTAQYTHTLTVTGRLGGLYHCTVSNTRPSQAMAGLTVRSSATPTNLEVSQSSTNALKVSWIPPNPLEDVTGYRVYYDSDGGSSGNIDIAGGSYTSQILSGLTSGVSYAVSLTALSAHLPSPVVRYPDMIPIMTKPVISVRTTRATSVVIVWRASFGAERYEVSYERVKGQQQNGHCRSQSHSGVLEVSAPTTRADITGLEEYSSYYITVTARRGHQSLITSEQVTFMTRSAGASAPPQDVVAIVESSTSIKLSWRPIGDCSAINGDITGWKVQYSGPGSSSRFVMVAGSNRANGQVTLTGLLFSTEYWFQVAAVNSNSQTGVYSRRITTTTFRNAPPTLSAVSHNTTAIEVTWSQTQLAGWDSSDIVYQFSYSTRERRLVTRLVRELSADTTSIVVDVRDSSPELQHVFTIRNNLKVQGKLYQGIPGNTSFIFDKAFIQLQFGSVEHCLTWTQEQAREIEEQLQFEITEAILQGCSECEQYTAGSLLRRGVFLCQSQPTMATYRSSLVSPGLPGLANASSLVQHIQHWVDTAPVVRLDWLLVRINQACPVALHQLSDPECSMPESLAHDPQVINAFNRCAIRSLGSQMCT